MAQMISDSASIDLLDAMEANMADFWSAYGRAPEAEVAGGDDLTWVVTGMPEALLNGVWRARMQPDEVEARLHALHAVQARRGVPMLWWLGPATRPENLGDSLVAHGWKHSGRTPGMAVDLADLALNGSLPRGMGFERARTRDEIRMWAQIAGIGTGFGPHIVERLNKMEPYAGSGDAESVRRYYVATQGGAPVATSVMVLAHGVAGIYGVATLPAARRRGIGAAITRLPLLEARDEGYRVGTLQSSEMGHSVYAGLGFRDVCMFEMYVREPNGA